MPIKEQLQSYLKWLGEKEAELAEGYLDQSAEGQRIYRRLLILVHAETVATIQLLKTI